LSSSRAACNAHIVAKRTQPTSKATKKATPEQQEAFFTA